MVGAPKPTTALNGEFDRGYHRKLHRAGAGASALVRASQQENVT